MNRANGSQEKHVVHLTPITSVALPPNCSRYRNTGQDGISLHTFNGSSYTGYLGCLNQNLLEIEKYHFELLWPGFLNPVHMNHFMLTKPRVWSLDSSSKEPLGLLTCTIFSKTGLIRNRLGCFCTHHSLGRGRIRPRAISKTDGRREMCDAAIERSRRDASKALSKC